MKILDITFFDPSRSRDIPICMYLPDDTVGKLPAVIFNSGYLSQANLASSDIPSAYKNYTYLAEFFISKNYVFISIQHDILGDNDGLETIDPRAPQHEAREHLWIRGVENILFVIEKLQQKFSQLALEKFIIAGHSNGGDMAKYFANLHNEKIFSVIALDARRCRIATSVPIKLLMFEAWDTSTDIGVIPDEGTPENPKRINLEYVIVKPKNALHMSYTDEHITEDIRKAVFSCIEWFLDI